MRDALSLYDLNLAAPYSPSQNFSSYQRDHLQISSALCFSSSNSRGLAVAAYSSSSAPISSTNARNSFEVQLWMNASRAQGVPEGTGEVDGVICERA
jgi:hypothetical protein